MKKYIFTIGIITALLSITACDSEETKKAEFPGNPIAVSVAKTQSENTGSQATASGKLVAKNSVDISTRMMGYITNLKVKVGQKVNAGQRLVSIHAADIQAKGGQANAQIAQAQAAYNSAKKDYERFQNLFNSESASQKELDDMRARYEMASAGLKAAQQMKKEVNAQHAYTNITTPISGVVTAKYAEQGDMANPGMPILSIESPSVLQAEVMVSENNIAQVKQDMEVNVLIKSSNKQVSGKVTEISQSSAQTGGQYIVKISVPKSEDLLPGMFVQVTFPFSSSQSDEKENANMMIPKSSIVTKGQLSGVYVVSSQNTAILRWLRLGKEMGDNVEVLSGLTANEKYIISADGKLYNGAKLTIK